MVSAHAKITGELWLPHLFGSQLRGFVNCNMFVFRKCNFPVELNYKSSSK